MSRRAGLIGGALGLAAAGAAVGLAAERYAIGRIRSGHDPWAEEEFGTLPARRSRVVIAEDGVPLDVAEAGAASAPLTVVFAHGYALSMGSFHFQRRYLAEKVDLPLRLVFYDQRAHGKSGRGEASHSTIEQLGSDLERVLATISGPVVLVGHSMGGMTIMALAGQRHEIFGGQVVGVTLLSTAAGMTTESTRSIASALASIRRPLIPVVALGLRRGHPVLEVGRRMGADIAWLLTRRYSFGSSDVSPALVGYVEKMIAATPVDVVGEFLTVISSFDKRGAVAALARVPVLIMVGEKDMLTPAAASEELARALPDATVRVLPGAGHLALMECPELTNEALADFVRAVMHGLPTGVPRARRSGRRR